MCVKRLHTGETATYERTVKQKSSPSKMLTLGFKRFRL